MNKYVSTEVDGNNSGHMNENINEHINIGWTETTDLVMFFFFEKKQNLLKQRQKHRFGYVKSLN